MRRKPLLPVSLASPLSLFLLGLIWRFDRHFNQYLATGLLASQASLTNGGGGGAAATCCLNLKPDQQQQLPVVGRDS